MTDKTSVRIAYIDIAKCVGIYLIVMGHMLRRGIILSYLVTAGVPLFFFLSGLITISLKKSSAFKIVVFPDAFAPVKSELFPFGFILKTFSLNVPQL